MAASKRAFTGVTLIDPEAIGEPGRAGTLLVEDGAIAGVVSLAEPLGPDWEMVEREGCFLAPGFIDLHFHGELMQARPALFSAALERAAARMPSEGTTAFLATTLAWAREELPGFVQSLAEIIDAQEGPALCLGLHLEGPWISPGSPGAMTRESIRSFSSKDEGHVLDRAGPLLKMVTLAPEQDGAGELLGELARRGAVAALGHTRATGAEIEVGIDRGLRHVTHLFNAMGPMHHREPGVPGFVLGEARLSCDLICDGHHVHRDMVRSAACALRERLLLISDRVDIPVANAVPGPGEPLRLADGTIAGSQISLDRALANLREYAQVSLTEAVAACTLRPARLLGMESERGTLRKGARADLVLLDAAGRVLETWIAGRRVHSQ